MGKVADIELKQIHCVFSMRVPVRVKRCDIRMDDDDNVRYSAASVGFSLVYFEVKLLYEVYRDSI